MSESAIHHSQLGYTQTDRETERQTHTTATLEDREIPFPFSISACDHDTHPPFLFASRRRASPPYHHLPILLFFSNSTPGPPLLSSPIHPSPVFKKIDNSTLYSESVPISGALVHNDTAVSLEAVNASTTLGSLLNSHLFFLGYLSHPLLRGGFIRKFCQARSVRISCVGCTALLNPNHVPSKCD